MKPLALNGDNPDAAPAAQTRRLRLLGRSSLLLAVSVPMIAVIILAYLSVPAFTAMRTERERQIDQTLRNAIATGKTVMQAAELSLTRLARDADIIAMTRTAEPATAPGALLNLYKPGRSDDLPLFDLLVLIDADADLLADASRSRAPADAPVPRIARHASDLPDGWHLWRDGDSPATLFFSFRAGEGKLLAGFTIDGMDPLTDTIARNSESICTALLIGNQWLSPAHLSQRLPEADCQGLRDTLAALQPWESRAVNAHQFAKRVPLRDTPDQLLVDIVLLIDSRMNSTRQLFAFVLAGGAATVIGCVILLMIVYLGLRHAIAQTSDFAQRLLEDRTGAKPAVRIAELDDIATELQTLATRFEADQLALANAQTQLRKRDRQHTTETLFGAVAHELRNPLGAIYAAVELLGLRLGASEPPDPVAARALKRATSNIERCNLIIDELFSYAKPTRVDAQPRQLAGLVSRLLGEIERQQSETAEACRLRVEIDIDPSIEVQFDAHRLYQVLLNLHSNARQAILATGRDSGRLWLRARRAANHCELLVGDDGPGVADEARERLFEPLFSTRPQGIGLGLAIVYKLMAESGGGVRLSPSDTGAVFCLSLPLGPSPPAEAS